MLIILQLSFFFYVSSKKEIFVYVLLLLLSLSLSLVFCVKYFSFAMKRTGGHPEVRICRLGFYSNSCFIADARKN